MKYSVVLACLATAGSAFPTAFLLPNIFSRPGHSDDQSKTQNGTSCERAFINALNTTEKDVRALVNAADSCFMSNGTMPVANFLSCLELRALDQGVNLAQLTSVVADLGRSCPNKRGMYVDHPFVRCTPANSSSCAQMVMNTLNTTTDPEAKRLYDAAAVCLGNGTVPYKKYVSCVRAAAPVARVRSDPTLSAFLDKLKSQCAPNRRNFKGGNKKNLVVRQETADSCLADAALTADLDAAHAAVARAAVQSCQSVSTGDADVYNCMKTYISSNDALAVPRMQAVLAVAFNAYSCSVSLST